MSPGEAEDKAILLNEIQVHNSLCGSYIPYISIHSIPPSTTSTHILTLSLFFSVFCFFSLLLIIVWMAWESGEESPNSHSMDLRKKKKKKNLSSWTKMHEQLSFKPAINTRQRDTEDRRERMKEMWHYCRTCNCCLPALLMWERFFRSFMLLQTLAYTAFSRSRFNVPMAL